MAKQIEVLLFYPHHRFTDVGALLRNSSVSMGLDDDVLVAN